MVKFLYYSFLLSVSTISVVIILITMVLWRYGSSLPDYNQLTSYKAPSVTRIYTDDGKLIEEYAAENRVYVSIDSIPKNLIDAFLVTEDKNFFQHEGIDFKGIFRAVVQNFSNVIEGKRLVGASTITQQVAKNFLLTNEVSFERKIKEALLALRIERTLTKDKILELYLNEIFLGFRSYGVVVAAKNYFNKSLQELNISEIAFLAGLPKAPNNYNPITRAESAINRRNYVLKRMIEEGIIHKRDAVIAMEEKIQVYDLSKNKYFDAPYFSEEVRREIISKYTKSNFYNNGYFVSTTLNSVLQNMAKESLIKGIENYDKRRGWRGINSNIDSFNSIDWKKTISELSREKNYKNKFLVIITNINSKEITIGFEDGSFKSLDLKESSWILSSNKDNIEFSPLEYKNAGITEGSILWVESKVNDDGNYIYSIWQEPEINGAIVALDPYSGRVLALVGGYNFNNNKFNRATQALRQSGSAFKPFVYLAALENGMNPSTLVLDTPLVIDQGPGLEDWIPKNYTGSYYGASTLRTGIEKSRNVMTVRLANTVGINKITEIANRFNIGKYPPQLATSLGAGETTLLSITAAYASFINGGNSVKAEFIESIHDRDGQSVYKRDKRICHICADEKEEVEIFNLPNNQSRILDENHAFQILWLLKGVIQNGTGKKLNNISNYIAGKTGTTNKNKDAWFIGFYSNLLVGVYIGFDLPKSLGDKETGGAVAAPIWGDFIKKSLSVLPARPFKIPKNIELVKIDHNTGMLPNADTKKIIFEAFIKGTSPVSDRQNNIRDDKKYRPLEGQIY